MNGCVVSVRSSTVAVRATLLYLLLSALWIWFSDQTIVLLFADVQTLYWAQASKGWLFVALTSVALFTLLYREMTRYERASDSLRTSEQYLGSIFRAAPVGIGMVRNRVIITVNDRLCTLTGYERGELVGRSSRLLYPCDAEFEEVGITKYEQIAQYGTGTVVTRWVRKDGAILDILLSSSPLVIGDLSVGVTFTAVDITASKQAERELREREERYRSLIDLAVDGILLCSHEGIIVDGNAAMCTLLGMERSAFIGQHLTTLPFDDPRATADLLLADHLQREQTSICERMLTLADGCQRSLEMRTTLMPDGSYQSIFRDITERKRTEQALRESEEKFALAFAASPDAVNINRLADGLYVEVNSGFSELTGYTREEVVGTTSLQLGLWHDPADRQRMVEELQANGYCENLEAVFRRQDGSCGTGLMSARPILLNGIPHLISITRDITRRKQAEADLERLKVAIEQAGEAVVITDVAGAILYANPAFSDATGYTREEVLQQNPRILKSGEHDEVFYQELWGTIASGRTWSGRVVNKKKDGTLYTEEATISPVFDQQGNIVNYVAIKRDITAQLKLEAQYLQAQKMESVGRLTGGVAHDFNNILAVITGYCEMAMAKAAPGQPVYSDLERIHEAALRSADIIRQLLAFSRKQAIIPRDIDLNEMVAGMLKMLQRMVGEGVELIWSPAANLPMIKMDPAQIDQILANLCVNGRDALDGSGTITLRTARMQLDAAYCAGQNGIIPGTYVVLTVTDNGCGIEPEVREKIFEPFFTTKGLLGTGLGLSTVYGIVKQNHGHVEVRSEPGQGATFLVYLPARDTRSLPVMEQALESPPMGRGETVLLVEDDIAVLALGQAMLESLGYRVLAAATPGEAMLLAKQADKRIDLLLTDVIMPTMNGKELADRLIDLRPSLKVLFMSGYAADVITEKATLGSNASFLQKPFSIKSLADTVRSVLAR
jgi:PAS domain S-box-containing protein